MVTLSGAKRAADDDRAEKRRRRELLFLPFEIRADVELQFVQPGTQVAGGQQVGQFAVEMTQFGTLAFQLETFKGVVQRRFVNLDSEVAAGRRPPEVLASA